MSSLIPSGSASGTGSMTLAAPVTNSNQTATLPDASGTVMVSGAMPAFSVYNNASQSITSSTWTKVALQLKEFDTANCFDSTTNYRFTPTVSGYYQINGCVNTNGTVISRAIISVYKNGVEYKRGIDVSSSINQAIVSTIVYFNGTTDYVELYGFITATSPSFNTSGTYTTWLNGAMVRAA